MILGDSIAALASSPGRSARAVIRLSGPGVSGALAQLLDRAPTARGASLARFRLTVELSLPVLVLFFPGPASYTGESSAELQLPGNPFLVERVLHRLTAMPGVRPAEPGEFSARAYLNGRLTVDQAEGIAAIVAAQNDEQVAAAHELLTGRTGSSYRGWAEEIATLLALVEAGIDFTDQEDVVAINPSQLASRIDAIVRDVDRHLGAAAGRGVDTALPRVALVGAPNAGKSTLFNALLGRRRAVASPVAGTTRDVLAEELDLTRESPGASAVILMDLAGLDADVPGDRAKTENLGFHAGDEASLRGEIAEFASSHASIESHAQARARRAALDADLILLCDPSASFDPREPWLAFIPPDKPTMLVQTKADIPHAERGAAWLARLTGDQETSGADHSPPPAHPGSALPDAPSAAATVAPLPVCALDGWNLPALRRQIADRTTAARAAGVAGLLPRHRRALLQVREHLTTGSQLARADAALGRIATPELAAATLRDALDAIGELVGRITPDEVLGRVFASFCVGK